MYWTAFWTLIVFLIVQWDPLQYLYVQKMSCEVRFEWRKGDRSLRIGVEIEHMGHRLTKNKFLLPKELRKNQSEKEYDHSAEGGRKANLIQTSNTKMSVILQNGSKLREWKKCSRHTAVWLYRRIWQEFPIYWYVLVLYRLWDGKWINGIQTDVVGMSLEDVKSLRRPLKALILESRSSIWIELVSESTWSRVSASRGPLYTEWEMKHGSRSLTSGPLVRRKWYHNWITVMSQICWTVKRSLCEHSIRDSTSTTPLSSILSSNWLT